MQTHFVVGIMAGKSQRLIDLHLQRGRRQDPPPGRVTAGPRKCSRVVGHRHRGAGRIDVIMIQAHRLDVPVRVPHLIDTSKRCVAHETIGGGLIQKGPNLFLRALLHEPLAFPDEVNDLRGRIRLPRVIGVMPLDRFARTPTERVISETNPRLATANLHQPAFRIPCERLLGRRTALADHITPRIVLVLIPLVFAHTMIRARHHACGNMRRIEQVAGGVPRKVFDPDLVGQHSKQAPPTIVIAVRFPFEAIPDLSDIAGDAVLKFPPIPYFTRLHFVVRGSDHAHGKATFQFGRRRVDGAQIELAL